MKKPDPDWKAICAKCHDGEIEPDCEYYGEPNGCNSPIYGEHPTTEKSSAVGNAAAMREALKMFVDAYRTTSYTLCIENLRPAFQKAEAALAAPPRNCDVGTAEEQEERYKASTDDVYHTLTLTNALQWAQMPYEKGESDGSK